MVDFAGYYMPIQYSLGVQEHRILEKSRCI